MLLASNPACYSGGWAFLPVTAALRPPASTLSWRRAGCRQRKLSLARANTDGSGSGVAASTVGDNFEGDEGGGGGGEAVASADSSAEKQPPPVNPKIEKELKKVWLTLMPRELPCHFSSRRVKLLVMLYQLTSIYNLSFVTVV